MRGIRRELVEFIGITYQWKIFYVFPCAMGKRNGNEDIQQITIDLLALLARSRFVILVKLYSSVMTCIYTLILINVKLFAAATMYLVNINWHLLDAKESCFK